MNVRAERAADQGKYIRALVLAGFDVALNSERMLVIRSRMGYEGTWETAREAWYVMKNEYDLKADQRVIDSFKGIQHGAA